MGSSLCCFMTRIDGTHTENAGDRTTGIAAPPIETYDDTMFGYLTPEKGELKVKEYEAYRAHYCGTCLGLKRNCSARSCAALTYDSAFLSVLCASMAQFNMPEPRRCPFKPWKKVNMSLGFWSEFAADANAVIAYRKCLDDKQDEHKLLGSAAAWFIGSGARKAENRLAAVIPGIDAGMARLAQLEKEKCDQLDEPALAFAAVMEELMGAMPAPKGAVEPLRWMGKNLGRWLYLIDAWDDMEKDAKSGSYNVLLLKFGSVEQARAERERMEYNLIHSLYQARTALNFLPQNQLTPIVDNILGEGTVRRTYRVLGKGPGCEEQNQHDIIENNTDHWEEL